MSYEKLLVKRRKIDTEQLYLILSLLGKSRRFVFLKEESERGQQRKKKKTFFWLPLAIFSSGAARGAAAAIDASVASAAGAAAARAEEQYGGPLSRWRDGQVDVVSGGGEKAASSRIPQLASEYWRPPAGAGTRTVLLAARADAVRGVFSFFLSFSSASSSSFCPPPFFCLLTFPQVLSSWTT